MSKVNEQIEKAFTFHPAKQNQAERYGNMRDAFKELATFIDEQVPDSREKSVAITHLETANFWANAGIARNE